MTLKTSNLSEDESLRGLHLFLKEDILLLLDATSFSISWSSLRFVYKPVAQGWNYLTYMCKYIVWRYGKSDVVINRKYLTIIPRARMGPESVAHEAEGRMGYWLKGIPQFAYLFTPRCKRCAQIYSPVCTNLHHICAEQIKSKSLFFVQCWQLKLTEFSVNLWCI